MIHQVVNARGQVRYEYTVKSEAESIAGHFNYLKYADAPYIVKEVVNMSKKYVVINDTNGVYKGVTYNTEEEAKVAAWDAIQENLVDRNYVYVQEIEVED